MFFALLIVWILINGAVTLELILVGGLLSWALHLCYRRIFRKPAAKRKRPLAMLLGAASYSFYLFAQVILANLQVMGWILRPAKAQEKRHPKLIWFHHDLPGDALPLVLANSITLTPGTVTVSVAHNRMCVYTLGEAFETDMKHTGFSPRLAQLERSEYG